VRNHHDKLSVFGIGRDVQPALGLSFPEAFEPDVFHLALTNGRAILIDNAREPRIVPRIPMWHREHFSNVKSFFLLPVRQRNQTVALLYGDWGGTLCAGGIGAKELEFLQHMGNEISSKLDSVAQQSGGAGITANAGDMLARKAAGEAGEIFGGGANAFSRYENGRTLPPVALLKLLRVLDRHPELLDEIRAGADQIGGQGVLQTRSSVARLSESDATKVKQKIAGDPTYAKSILSRAGVLTESGKLAKKYR